MKQLSLLLFLLALASCKNPIQEPVPSVDADLGFISMTVTGAEEAMPHFEKGMLLLHSFEYEDAAENFQKAQETDSTFYMAYWGEAMTHNHPLWREQDGETAREILSRVGKTKQGRLDKIKTKFERDLFLGAEILFADRPKTEKDMLYREHMLDLYNEYPDNHEIASLYALSILGAVKGGRDFEANAKCAKIAQGILEENENHPGALHYLIHSYDDPDNAHKALSAANAYADVAPSADHALHMPSHIFVALGMWDEVIRSNQESYQASVDRMIKKDLDDNARSYHAFKWLMYGHLQKGDFQKAASIRDSMQHYCELLPSKLARNHLIMMNGAYYTETESWSEADMSADWDNTDLNIQVQSIDAYNKFMASTDSDQKGSYISSLEQAIQDTEKKVRRRAEAMCSGTTSRSQATPQNVERARVVLLELKAMQAMDSQDIPTVEKYLIEAIEKEHSTAYAYGPPEIVKPSAEMMADWLMEQNRREEAIVYYNQVLERNPKKRIPTIALQANKEKA